MRNNYLDVLKGIAIVLVVASHSSALLAIESPFLYKMVGQDLGRLGVLIFFLISGALSYIQYSTKTLKSVSFMFNKLKSLYFLSVLGTFLMVLIYYKLNMREQIIDTILTDISLLKSFIPTGTYYAYSLNTPAWYLSVMVLCWLMTKSLIKFLKNYSKSSTGSLLLVYLLLIIYMFIILKLDLNSDIQRWFTYINPVVNLGIYFFGMIIGKIYLEFKENKPHVFISVIILLTTYLIKDYVNIDLRVILLLPSSSFVLYNILLFNKEGNKSLSLYTFIGNNSNYIFLLHYPICYLFRNFFSYNLFCFLLCLLLSIFGTICLGKLVENFINKVKIILSSHMKNYTFR